METYFSKKIKSSKKRFKELQTNLLNPTNMIKIPYKVIPKNNSKNFVPYESERDSVGKLLLKSSNNNSMYYNKYIGKSREEIIFSNRTALENKYSEKIYTVTQKVKIIK